ncbi:polyadenylate-binding protein [Moniliophthora roreri MCA 2997]|nr:polyadenylate-binding protein [Moniliophthora roreri MCA 2997]
MQVKSAAESFGVLKKINIPLNSRGKPAGFANIEFADERDAVSFFDSIEEYGLSVGERKVRALLFDAPQTASHQYVEKPCDTVYLNKLPKNVTRQDLKDSFGWYGEILKIIISPGEEGPMAFVQFSSEEIATRVVRDARNSQVLVNGQKPWVNFSKNRPADPAALPKSSKQSDIIHLAGLPPDTTTHELKEVFGAYGEIQRVDLPESLGRTIGFIKFSSKESALRAVEASQNHQIRFRGERPYVDFSTKNIKKTDPRQRTDRLYLSALPGTQDDVKELFRPYQDNIRGMFFFKQADRIASIIIFDSQEAAARALEGVKKNRGDFTLEYAKSWPKNTRNKNSERRNSYGGDWEGGARSSQFYPQ